MTFAKLGLGLQRGSEILMVLNLVLTLGGTSVILRFQLPNESARVFFCHTHSFLVDHADVAAGITAAVGHSFHLTVSSPWK